MKEVMTQSIQLPRSRHRWWLWTTLVCACAALFGIWRWKQASLVPPQVETKDLDPAVARLIAEAQERVRRQPRSGEAWGRLGQVFLAHDLESQALVCFCRAQEVRPNDARWHYFAGVLLGRTDVDGSVQHLKRAAELCAVNDAENTAPRLRLAEMLLEHEYLDSAEEQYRLVLAVQPDQPRACFGLSMVAARRGNAEESCRQLEKCLQSPYARKKAATDLARECRRRGENDRAEEYQRAAAGFPRDRDWPDPFTSEFRALGVGRKALLSRAEQFEGLGRWNDAVEQLRQVAEEYQDYHAYIGLGCNFGRMNRFREAEGAFRKALELAPEKMQAYYWLSATIVLHAEASRDQAGQSERYQEAVELGRKALALKPDHALAHYYLGKSLLRLGRRGEGLAELRESIGCLPGIPEPYLTLAEALAADGNVEQARRTLEEARRLSLNEDKRVREALARLEPSGRGPAQ
jgi:tetratricopeptide (TPR) repeat protein